MDRYYAVSSKDGLVRRSYQCLSVVDSELCITDVALLPTIFCLQLPSATVCHQNAQI